MSTRTPNPLLGLQYDAATVRGFLDSIKRRIHAHTSQINGSHAVYISHPNAVVRLAEQAARATG